MRKFTSTFAKIERIYVVKKIPPYQKYPLFVREATHPNPFSFAFFFNLSITL